MTVDDQSTIANASVGEELFDIRFEEFLRFVESADGKIFGGFREDNYVSRNESYKVTIYRLARARLSFESWVEGQIGSGEIIEAVIRSIEIDGNNLLPWQARFGDEQRIHSSIRESRRSEEALREAEQVLFNLYRAPNVKTAFERATALFGKRYPLLAYLCFLRDCDNFLPISPKAFELSLGLLGAPIRLNAQCSWQNYSAFVGLIRDIQAKIEARYGFTASLLDAHSFAWILATKLATKDEAANQGQAEVQTENLALRIERRGQDKFRRILFEQYNGCCLSGTKNPDLLEACHILGWSCSPRDRLLPENGLLLTATLHACFDRHLISFTKHGRILISTRLSPEDQSAIGIHAEMRLDGVSPTTLDKLADHRKLFERKEKDYRNVASTTAEDAE